MSGFVKYCSVSLYRRVLLLRPSYCNSSILFVGSRFLPWQVAANCVGECYANTLFISESKLRLALLHRIFPMGLYTKA